MHIYFNIKNWNFVRFVEALLNGCNIKMNVGKYQFLGGKSSNNGTKEIRNAFFFFLYFLFLQVNIVWILTLTS